MVLTDEIQGGHFREIKPSQRAVKDQFKRFQERNLIEPRKRTTFKKRPGFKGRTKTRKKH